MATKTRFVLRVILGHVKARPIGRAPSYSSLKVLSLDFQSRQYNCKGHKLTRFVVGVTKMIALITELKKNSDHQLLNKKARHTF